MRASLVLWTLAAVLVATVVPLGLAPAGHAAPSHASVGVRPDLTQFDGYRLQQISLPNFAYLYSDVYNYRDQYPVLPVAGPCVGGVLYITNSSVMDCYTVANATAWPISPSLYLLHQRTVGIQAQIDNEFQMDAPYDVALLYGNNSTSAGPVTVETLNLTTGVLHTVATPVPMANSIQSDYVGGNLVVTWNQSGTNGGPEITNVANGTSWRSGLGVGVAPNNVYWVAALNAFLDVAGTHLAELQFNGARTSLKNVGNAWVNTTGVTSVTAVDGVVYYADTGQLAVELTTNLGARIAVVKLTNGLLTPAGAYSYSTTQTLYIQRYAYTSGYVWATVGGKADLFDPLHNLTLGAPNLRSTANSSGANGNFEFTLPTTTAISLSLATNLTGNATRAPNQFVYATYPVAVHARAFVLTNPSAKVGAYQQKLVVNSTVDAAWEAANLSNVFWTYASNGTSVPAWIEANASSASATTVWWLSLAALGHGASVTVDEDFAPTTALTFGRTAQTGEAPTLTVTYGAYDNGAVVFPLYDDFAGGSLNTGLWVSSFASGAAVVNNGLTTTSVQSGAATQGACGLVAKYQNVSGYNYAVETWGTFADTSRFGPMTATTHTTPCGTASTVLQNLDFSHSASTSQYYVFSQASAGSYNTNTPSFTWKSTANYLLSLNMSNTSGGAHTSVNYTLGAGGGFANMTSTAYAGVFLKANSGTIGPTYWVRERVVPTVMPTSGTTPLAPTNVAVSGTSFTTVSLTWTNPPSTVVNDTVYGWLGSSCVGSAVGNSTVGKASALTVGGLLASTHYSFRVAAWNATGQGVLSSCVAATTQGGENAGVLALLDTGLVVPLWVAAGAGILTLVLAVAWIRSRD